MSNFLDNALKLYPNRSHVLVADNIPFINAAEVTGEEGYPVRVHRTANLTEVQADAIVSVQPTTSTPANINGSIVDFKPQNVIDRFDHAYLKISFVNNDAAPCTIVPSPFLLNYWQIFAGNGNNMLYQQYGYELWQEIVTYSNTLEWNTLQNLVGSNATYSTAGVTIAAGGTTSLYIPLASVFMASRIFLQGLNDNLLIRFTFQPSTLNLISGVTPSVNNMQLLLRGCYEPQAVRELKMKMYKQLPLDFPYLGSQRSQYTQSITANGNYKIQLQGINGLVSHMWIWAYLNPTTASSVGTFADIWSSFDITEQNGNSILGYYVRDTGDTINYRNDNQISWMEYSDNTYSLNKNVLLVSFTRDPAGDFRNGSSHGFQPFDGFNVLQFTAKSTAPPGSYNIVVTCRTSNTIKVRQGILSTNN
jgi:hypothetical protein